ncbi:TIGR03862 family flavoprotein [Acetobacter sp. AN02]|uniref:NAD(P)/FAD-dependent oxidoreductase n=1 Tax=Acetobacter sp. AN02 TaxID=2894186 RepID=UPI0024342D90|nr:TIGR03862 family flavoprotein [Acetobacter sp. AN02]MDG6095278.1 TIGR03862 family flavoprotein [Acetobacter sp. AN02]
MPPASSGIVVVGSGPAGLAAAETLSAAGLPVTILERMPSPARKLLMAGRSGLNLTHSESLPLFLSRYGAAESWLAPALNGFSPNDTVSWAESLGQACFTGTSGRIFPRVKKASPLLRAWLARLQDQGVTLRTRTEWTGFTPDHHLLVRTAGKGIEALSPAATILATGGASWSRLGSDGAWARILTEQNLPVAPFRPANCGFHFPWSEPFRNRFAGEPLKSALFSAGGEHIRGEAVITERGLEGGAIYSLSARLRDGIDATGSARLSINLRPDMTEAQIVTRLNAVRARESLSNRLRKALRLSPLAIALLRETGPLPATAQELAALIRTVPLRLTATDDMDRAISVAGGLMADALDNHFMIRTMPGVFACGEMLDWEARTGGYLLQACLSTGRAAAQGAVAWLRSAPRTL